MTAEHYVTTDAAITAIMYDMGFAARAAARELAQATSAAKDAAIHGAAAAIRERNGDILAANAKDVAAWAGRGRGAG